MLFINKMQISFLCLLTLGSSLLADCEMCHTIIFSVKAINYFGEITGPSPVFDLRGSQQSATWNNTYSISTNEVNKKISAFLDADMPQGLSLQVNLSPPTGARTLGTQTLSATPIDLVLEVSMVNASGLPMVYTFSTDAKSGVVPNTTRIVTYTLIDG